ncbi:DNA polymerase III subunit gamma/tau [Paenibacillus sp. J2TS4]|uniref:DNA polymerase III subunit gamma/tau n=1 Tax=Paenibacillus sp. J2TS4 TaxID=2807194 RepID=UPI001BCE1C81|nr:DNA polymerase III subunit gamma/tau [Paenibacillus sp. J2TS4]
MTQHIALYRTWRPQFFKDVVGQQHIVQTLQNSLRENRLTHAYLFSGPRGTGKTSAAKILAKAVNCEQGPAAEPCNECDACRRITEGAIMDVVEIDAASNRGVEEIRDIRDKVKFAPTEVRQKVYIIDEVHMLTTEAFNALLKTLEEPPGHVMFILATTEPHKIPATIISRCQRFDFRRVPLEEQVSRLDYVCRQENVDVQHEALQYIARLSQGGMRDALSLLDQIASFSGGKVTYDDVVAMTGGVAADHFEKLSEMIRNRQIGGALQLVDELLQGGKSPDKCVESLMHYFRDLLLIKMVPDSSTSTERILDPAKFSQTAASFSREELFAAIEVLNRYHGEMKYSSQPQILFEIAIMKLCHPAVAEQELAQPAEQASSARNSQGEDWSVLKRKVEQLEHALSKLSASPQAVASPQAAAPAAGTFGVKRSGGTIRKSSIKLDPFVRQQEAPLFKQALSKWSQILAQVKEQKITVHAWLVDGEPVSLADDTLLLAFKSAMHRETTEKPANKQLIEQVMQQVLGHPIQLAAVMNKEWKEALEEEPESAEEMTLEPEQAKAQQQPWIDEAIQLFGEDLVKIKKE